MSIYWYYARFTGIQIIANILAVKVAVTFITHVERVFTRRYHRRDVVIKLKINFNWQCDHTTGKTICFILLMFCVWISLHATMIFFFLSANLIKIIPCIRLYVCTYNISFYFPALCYFPHTL